MKEQINTAVILESLHNWQIYADVLGTRVHLASYVQPSCNTGERIFISLAYPYSGPILKNSLYKNQKTPVL